MTFFVDLGHSTGATAAAAEHSTASSKSPHAATVWLHLTSVKHKHQVRTLQVVAFTSPSARFTPSSRTLHGIRTPGKNDSYFLKICPDKKILLVQSIASLFENNCYQQRSGMVNDGVGPSYLWFFGRCSLFV